VEYLHSRKVRWLHAVLLDSIAFFELAGKTCTVSLAACGLRVGLAGVCL
jgi:hypothetical protein